MANQENIIRCGWITKDPLYIKYHDEEWGKPEYDSVKLFETLCLEGQQSGLSWLTVLKKRQGYRKCFYNFHPNQILKISDSDLENIMNNSGVIRHKGKIEAIVNNAECFLKMENNGEDFSKFIWNFVDNKVIINHWQDIKCIPSLNEISTQMSKSLKQRGFKYVGPTTCYAFMQACGLVNDHIESCICRIQIKPLWLKQ